METNYVLFLVNYVLFLTYHARHLIFSKKAEIHLHDTNDEIKKRNQQILSYIFTDNIIFIIYLLTIFEKIPITNERIYYILQISFILSSIYNIDLNENKKYIFMQIFNFIVITFFIFNKDPLVAYIIRFLNNFFNIIFLKLFGFYMKKVEKEYDTIYKNAIPNQCDYLSELRK